MVYRTGADIVLVLHFLFVLFVVAGAFLLLRFPRIAYLHIPVALWGVFVEVSGRLCPLTILENHWRHSAGQEGYSSSFIEHYLMPLIYPAELTREIQFGIAAIVALINGAVYGWLMYRWWQTRWPGSRH